MNHLLSRRKLLKQVGAGMAAGLLPAVLPRALAQAAPSATATLAGAPSKPAPPAATNLPGKTPISLIIDDGSPVDPLFYELPGYETPWLVPGEFTRRVAGTFEKFGLRGKMTIIPMPSCLGRIDQSLKRVPPEHLADFLKVVREQVAPRFDITPEFLTHLNAYDLKTGKFQHIYEDVWLTRAPLVEIVDYFKLAFQILANVGLPATGITSPWDSGLDVEKKYAQALGAAQWQVHQRKLTWYFLHATAWENPLPCKVEYEDTARGQTVVSVPANADDIFWSMRKPPGAERLEHIRTRINRLVSEDGGKGRIRQLIESGCPVVLLTHWQSLYTQGTGLGLEGLNTLMERIQKAFGSNLEWVTCSEQARRYVAAARG
jgi:hypothetical protein